MNSLKKCIIILISVLVLSLFTGCGEKAKSFEYDPGEPFVTDVFKSTRLLKVDITIEVTDEKLVELLTANTAKVRDTIVFILRSKTEEELKGLAPNDGLKTEIIDKLKEKFDTSSISEIYVSDLVIQ